MLPFYFDTKSPVFSYMNNINIKGGKIMETVFYIALLLAAVIGFAHIFEIFENWLLKPRKKVNTVTIVPLSGHIEDVEQIIRDLKSGDCLKRETQYLLADTGMDKETRDICETLCSKDLSVTFCESYQISDLLQRSMKSKL